MARRQRGARYAAPLHPAARLTAAHARTQTMQPVRVRCIVCTPCCFASRTLNVLQIIGATAAHHSTPRARPPSCIVTASTSRSKHHGLQCGGKGWSGPTSCASGSRCVRKDDYYSQCVPSGQGAQEQAAGTAGAEVTQGFTPKAPKGGKSGKKTYLRAGAQGVTMGKPPYDYEKALGLAIRFLELQRSGAIEGAPGGNNFPWRQDHLLLDGKEPPVEGKGAVDLVGGHYEAGNRLKITLASGYALARLAFTCLYYKDIYLATEFEGRNMWYWCHREVKWGADWLLKAHLTDSPHSGSWGSGDKLVLQARPLLWSWRQGLRTFLCWLHAALGGYLCAGLHLLQSAAWARRRVLRPWSLLYLLLRDAGRAVQQACSRTPPHRPRALLRKCGSLRITRKRWNLADRSVAAGGPRPGGLGRRRTRRL